MREKRFLILMFEKYLISCYLLRKQGLDIRIIDKKDVRLYRNSFNFNLSEYILDLLSKWGREIGVELVKENVPIINRDGDSGVHDIFIFSPKRTEDLCALTKHVYRIDADVKQEGALNISKFFEFQNLLYISLGSLETSVIRYFMQNKATMKVLVEKKDFILEKFLDDKDFMKNIISIGKLLGADSITDLLANVVETPITNIKYMNSALLEYFINWLRLDSFRGCSKLQLQTFGAGNMDENLLIIGGERCRIINNYPLEILSILNTLDLKGNFSIYIDRYGVFDTLQRSKKEFFTDKFYRSYLLEFWGDMIIVEGDRKAKTDDIVADVDVLDTESERQIIPMFDRIVSFLIEEKSDIKIDIRDRFYISNAMKQTAMEVKNYKGNFVIDSRKRSICESFDTLSDTSKSEKLKSWFKSLGII